MEESCISLAWAAFWLTFRNSYSKPSLTFFISLLSWDGFGDAAESVPTQTILQFCEITRGMRFS